MSNGKKGQNQSAVMDYSCSSMTLSQRTLLIIVFVAVFSAVFYIFYHMVSVSIILSVLLCPLFYKRFMVSSIHKRRRRLRLQFRDLLESLSVSVRAGNNESAALLAALEDLKLTYNEDSDIVIEVKNIIAKYNNGVPLRALFEDFGERSGVEDIKSFAQIFRVIEGRSNRFGDIVKQTHQIISDKIEIEEEIKTTITSSQSEQNIMFVLPVVIMLAMSTLGGSFMNVLFESAMGRVYVTVSIVIFLAAYFIARKMTDIKV